MNKINNKLVEVKDLSWWYLWKDVFSWVSFSIYRWEIISIIWKNWTWKSTLLKIIAWILSPLKWEIKRSCKKISYVPQSIDIDKSLPITAFDFVSISNEKSSSLKIKETFKKFNIEKLINRNINDLSWWELQKVLILSSLIEESNLVLLDEPTRWIDVIWEEEFYKNIEEIKKIYPEITIIIVSHNLHLVYKNSDKIICMHSCCSFISTPEKIFQDNNIKEIFWEHVWAYAHNHSNKNNHN